MKTSLLSVMVALGSVASTTVAARDLQGGAPSPASRAGIEEEFDRNKGSLYALYIRARRDQPTLAGKIVVEIDIAATGMTRACRVKSSELKAPDFERQLCERILLFRYPPQKPSTITKPLDFHAAAGPRAKGS